LLFIEVNALERPCMILTCPACDTKYVVKDGAIPPAGRQVRCASCKHSWHQHPEPLDLAPPIETDEAADLEASTPSLVAAEAASDTIAEQAHDSEPTIAAQSPSWADETAAEESDGESKVDIGEMPTVATDWSEPDATSEAAVPTPWPEPSPPEEEPFASYAPIDEAESPGRKLWPMLLGALVLIAVAAASFWFLAPARWKAQAGIAEAGTTPLELLITTRDRQTLESGNELVAVSGRVINPTDEVQSIPPIRAELRDKDSGALVHRWTIAAPAATLAPRSSTSFNSAEVDVPKGGELLTVSLGE
jgi:predicted Zn finger-like uncharacterized protein